MGVIVMGCKSPVRDWRRQSFLAVQNSAEVIVLPSRDQREQEGPNDEEQGGAISQLATRELLEATCSAIGRRC